MPLDRKIKPSIGPDPVFTFPAIARCLMAGQVHTWTVRRTDVPVVALAVMVPGGSAGDPSDRRGLTALMADLLDEGTTSRATLQLHEELARLGAELETDVGADTTVLSLLTLARHFDRALDLLGDMWRHPRFDEADFGRVRDLRLNRLRQMRDVPSAVADRAFARDLFGDHAYAHTPLGSEVDLSRTSRDEVAAHHRQRFGTSGAHVVVVGDVDPAHASSAVERLLGGEAATAASALAVTDATPRPQAQRIVLVDRPGAVQSQVRVGRVAVARRTPLYFPLLLANAVLGGQFVSRLNTNLREKKGYTYGVRSAFDFRKAAGPFVVATSVQTDATAATVHEILREMAELGGARPVTADELWRAKAALTRGYPRGFESAEQVARGALMLATHDLPLDHFSRFAERVEAVTIETLTAAARAVLEPDAMRVTVVGDAEKVGPALDALGLGGHVPLDAARV